MFLKSSFSFFTFFIFSFFHLNGQNLILNPGFEDFIYIDQFAPSIESAQFWYSAGGSPEHHYSCRFFRRKEGIDTLKIPEYQTKTRNGCRAAGLICTHMAGAKHREFIITKLSQPLIKDQNYLVEFYVKMAEYFSLADNGIAAYFSTEGVKFSETEYLNYKPQIIVSSSEPIIDTKNWTRVSGIYKAQGGEQFMTVGNFTAQEKVKKYFFKEDSSNARSYYLIDDFFVGTTDSVPSPPDFSIVLRNVNFDVNEAEILGESFLELDSIVNLLLLYPNSHIEIVGHTDSSGVESNNLKLSEERAKAVALYFFNKKIDEERVSHKGLGSSSPLVANNNEHNRKLNRRVELFFRSDKKEY
jgi:OmpA-OmpF porin, OOP family